MISLTIIIGSVVLAMIYALAWILVPGIRQQIEQPKHCFQQRLEQYDQVYRNNAGPVETRSGD